jgi:hypothetical protein
LGGTFFDNVRMQEEEREYRWDPEEESVANYNLTALFREADNWYDDWVPPVEEALGDFALLVPLFDESNEWYDAWFQYLEICIWDCEDDEMIGMFFLVPLFDEDSDSPWYLTEEAEPNRLFPLFQGDWYIPGNVELAPIGVLSLYVFWHEATLPCDEDDDEYCYGAKLFA